MSRPGELYDQDAVDQAGDERRPAAPSPPSRAGPGTLYDQDAQDQLTGRSTEASRKARPKQEPWRREAELRRREREIELLRLRRMEQERSTRIQRRRDGGLPPGPTVRITSRPSAPPSLPALPTGGSGWRPQPATRGSDVPGAGGPSSRGRRSGSPTSGQTSAGDATAVLAAGTLASRLTGFARVLVVGYVLGVSSLSDAFNYANGIPNIVYDLLLGGILSATLIPVFVEQFAHNSEEEAERAVSAVLSAIGVALTAISALLWVAAPWVIRFYLVLNSTPSGAVEKQVATKLLQYFSPQVFLLGAIVVTTALLNTRRRFAAAAFSPVLNNLIAIAALLATKFAASSVLTRSQAPAGVLERFSRDQEALLILGIGTTAGYLAQLAAQLPAMRRAGYRLRLVWEPGHPAVRRVARLSSWLVGVVIANQASLALVMILAGRTEGGVTAYQFSYQFFQLPYALVAVSVASAIMPDLAELWAAGNRRGLERRFVTGLRTSLAVLVPAAMVYAAVAQPFIDLAVHHGRVSAAGAHLVASSLALFAAGLPGFSAFFLLMRLYQAMQDARAMFWIYLLENTLTALLAVTLEPLLGVPGLALAWVAPYSAASLVAIAHLRRSIGRLGGAHTVRALVRVLVAGALATATGLAVTAPLAGHQGDLLLLLRLVVQVGMSALVYLVLARIFGVKELRPLLRLAVRLAGPRRASPVAPGRSVGGKERW